MARKHTLRDYLENVPEELKDKINRSFEIVGDIAIIELSEDTQKYDREVAKALMKLNKNIKTVLKKSGIHSGEFRTQDLEYVYGEEKYETIYLENGIRLKLNPGTVYFSARLSTERENLMKDLEEKRVLVMFSGSGPYSYVAHKKNPNIDRITSIEINPQGHKYALESMSLNKNIVKKSQIYKQVFDFLKENNLPLYEKKLIELLNNLKLFFINGDVKKEVSKLVPKKYENEIEEFHNELFKQESKDLFDFLKQANFKELFFDLDNLELDKEKVLNFFVIFSEKFNFVCKINNELFEFDNWYQKNLLLNHLMGKNFVNIEKYDEIFMPLPKDASLFLDQAFQTIARNGVVHMYDFVHIDDFPKSSEDEIKKAAIRNNREIEILEVRKVGQYSPRKYRVCADFKVK